VRNSDPNWPAIGQKFDIDGVSVSGSNGDNYRLIGAVDLFFRPPIFGYEIIVHAEKTISDACGRARKAAVES